MNFPLWIQLEGLPGKTVWNEIERQAYIKMWESLSKKNKAENAPEAVVPVAKQVKKTVVKKSKKKASKKRRG